VFLTIFFEKIFCVYAQETIFGPKIIIHTLQETGLANRFAQGKCDNSTAQPYPGKGAQSQTRSLC
jgi:hypothetical protein